MPSRYPARPRSSKYHAHKREVDGIVFDSQKESSRYVYLSALEEAGEIHDLVLQKRYTLIPAQRKSDGSLERQVNYIADFVYRNKDGELVVEDTKGFKTKDYIIKRKLMLYIHGIEVKEV